MLQRKSILRVMEIFRLTTNATHLSISSESTRSKSPEKLLLTRTPSAAGYRLLNLMQILRLPEVLLVHGGVVTIQA